MTLDEYLTYDENEAKKTEIAVKQDMEDAIESLASTNQVLQ